MSEAITKIDEDTLQMEETYFEHRLTDSFNVGVRGTWGDAVKLMRKMSGDAYAEGDDKRASVLRGLAKTFEEKEQKARQWELQFRRDYVETGPATPASA